MRSNWIGNVALRERLLRANPTAHEIVQALAVTDSDVKNTYDDWLGDDSVVKAHIALEDGGAKLEGTRSVLAEGTSGTDNLMTSLGMIPPFDVIKITWKTAAASQAVLDRVTIRMEPDVDSTGVLVTDFRVRLYRLARYFGSESQYVELQPISQPVTVAESGSAPYDVTFDFRSVDYGRGILIGPPPINDGGASGSWTNLPVTYVVIEPLKGGGEPATNAAVVGDSGVSSVDTSAYTAEKATLSTMGKGTDASTGAFIESATGGGAPRFSLEKIDFTSLTITFSGGSNRPQLSATPTDPVEVNAVGQTPTGTTLTFEIREPGGTWYECADGDVVGEDNSAQGGFDLSAIANRADYDMRVTLDPGSGYQTPIVRDMGISERAIVDLEGVATVESISSAIDPVTLKGEVGEAIVRIARDGITDYRDAGSELFSGYYIGDLAFRIMIGADDLDRKDWLHVDTYLVEDYDSTGPEIVVSCLSALSLTSSVVIPAWDDVLSTREPKSYENLGIKTIWEDLITSQMIVPGRYVGQGPLDDSTLLAKTIDESKGKDELDAVGFVGGGGNIASQGRIKFVDMYPDDPASTQPHPLEAIPREEIKTQGVTPGFRGRVMEFFVPYEWDSSRNNGQGDFNGELRSVHAAALTNLGDAKLDVPDRLDAEIAKWIPDSTVASTVGQRQVKALGTGLILIDVETTYPNPALEPGDPVAVEIDRFVARDPNVARELRGLLWMTGVVQQTQGAMGRRLTVWVQGYANIFPSDTDITRKGFAAPTITDFTYNFNTSGELIATLRVVDGLSVRIAASDSAFPSDATVDAASLQTLDSNGWVSVNLGSGFSSTVYLKGIAYEIVDGTGAAGFYTVSQTFKVEYIEASAGTIGDWTIGANALESSSGNIVLDSANEAITVGAASAPMTGVGVYIGDDGSGNFDLRAGDPAGHYIHWDASAGTLDIVGSLTATTGTIGGWTIGATTIEDSTGGITLDSSTPAIEMGSATGPLTGAGVWMGLDGGAYDLRAGDPSGGYIHWDGSAATLTLHGAVIQSPGTGTDLSLIHFSHDLTFSATDSDTVAWTSGTIRFGNGQNYSIVSGNTGNMAAVTYVYLDTATSTTVLQTSTTLSDAVGTNKALVAVCANVTSPKDAEFYVYGGGGTVGISKLVTADVVATDTLTANEIASLSFSGKTATFDQGSVGGWTLAGGSISATGITISATDRALEIGSATAPMTGVGIWVGYDGSSSYDLRAGDPAGEYIHWDGSASTLTITGTISSSSTIEAQNFTSTSIYIGGTSPNEGINLDGTQSTGGIVTVKHGSTSNQQGGHIAAVAAGFELNVYDVLSPGHNYNVDFFTATATGTAKSQSKFADTQVGVDWLDLGTGTGAISIDFDSGNVQHLDNTGSRSVTLSNGQDGFTYILSVVAGAGAVSSWTWTTTVLWVGGTAPTLSTGSGDRDVIYLMYVDSVWLGSYSLGHA